MSPTHFTARTGGVSSGAFAEFNLATHVGDAPEAVSANRALLADQIQILEPKIFYMNQVHGAVVVEIDEASSAVVAPTADALFTSVPGTALVVLVADCIPLLLSAPSAVAAVHVGRRGLINGVVDATLACFAKYGISRHEISAELGASICVDCYEVDIDTYREVVASHPATATDETRHHLDLSEGLLTALADSGVQTRASRDCTAHSPGYFSYRRDRVTGRQAGVIWL